MELANTKQQNENTSNCITKKQKILENWSSRNSIVTQKKLDTAILRFIVENILPSSIVDSSTFVVLVRIGISSNVNIMCRKTLKEKVDQAYFKMKTAVENKLAEVEVVSTTTSPDVAPPCRGGRAPLPVGRGLRAQLEEGKPR